MKHARLSPSSSSRWLTCTASVQASEAYENKGNSASEWGTNVHYVGEQLLKNVDVKVGDVLQENGNTFTVDKEMLDVAEEYADYCRGLLNKTSEMLVEKTFDLGEVSVGQFGTSDCTIIDGNTLHIVDLKTGHNIVSAENNTQLMLYAIGAVDYLQDTHDIEEIVLHIVQTRAGHVSSWSLDIDALMLFKVHAMNVAERIIEGDVEFNPNEKACKWCPHQVNCEALSSHVEKVVVGAFDTIEDIDGQADKVPMSHIKKILDNEELIINFIKAIKDVALEKLQYGEEIEGYKLVRSRKHKAWINNSEAEVELGKLLGDEAFKKSLITPTQAMKIAKKKGVDIDDLWSVPEGDIILAPLSDKRETVGSICEQFN
jgi:hypothetical protein